MEAICWIDIETTGLDPQVDEILEISVYLTDIDGVHKGTAYYLITPALDIEMWDEFISNMHSLSGLKADLQGTKRSFKAIEVDTFLADYVRSFEFDKVYLGGSSVHFDRSFLKEHMPELENCFTYRHVDVTTLKICGPELTVPEIEPKHRAYSDVISSYNYFMEYKAWMNTKK